MREYSCDTCKGTGYRPEDERDEHGVLQPVRRHCVECRGTGDMREVAMLRSLITDDLIRLDNILSGGVWLKLVRRALNWRVGFDVKAGEYVRVRISAHSWDCVTGRY